MTTRASIFDDDSTAQPLDIGVLSKPAKSPAGAENLEKVKDAAEKRGFVSREPIASKSARKVTPELPKQTGRPRSPLTEQMTYKARPEVVARFNQKRMDEGQAETGRIITQGDFLERLLNFYEENKK